MLELGVKGDAPFAGNAGKGQRERESGHDELSFFPSDFYYEVIFRVSKKTEKIVFFEDDSDKVRKDY